MSWACQCDKPVPVSAEGVWHCDKCGDPTPDPTIHDLMHRVAVLTARDIKRELANAISTTATVDPQSTPRGVLTDGPISLPEAADRVRMTPRHFRDSMKAMGVKYTQPSGPGGRYLIDPASLPKPEAHNDNGKVASSKRRKPRARKSRGTDLLPVAEKGNR